MSNLSHSVSCTAFLRPAFLNCFYLLSSNRGQNYTNLFPSPRQKQEADGFSPVFMTGAISALAWQLKSFRVLERESRRLVKLLTSEFNARLKR